MSDKTHNLTLSALPKTWFIDVDGTIVKHNGHLEFNDELLNGVKEFFEKISAEDHIIFTTARKEHEVEGFKVFLKQNNIHYTKIISDLPTGERILINDCKPSGLQTAFAVNKKRDGELKIDIKIDDSL